MKYDYLKYWRVVRIYAKTKYKLGQADLDMLFFLYSEGYFNSDKFDEFDNVLGWDITRMRRLIRTQWISVFRKGAYGNKTRVIYTLSYKARRVIENIYKKLEGEQVFSQNSHANRMFRKDVAFSVKVHRMMIRKMNSQIRDKSSKKYIEPNFDLDKED